VRYFDEHKRWRCGACDGPVQVGVPCPLCPGDNQVSKSETFGDDLAGYYPAPDRRQLADAWLEVMLDLGVYR
jgi:hypothetical protein